MILAVTGHRPPKIGGYRTPNRMSREVSNLLMQYLTRERPDVVITGMALGFDQWVASTCRNMGIPYHAYVPCPGQDSQWPDYSRRIYDELLREAALVRYVSPAYDAGVMQRRNIAMVEACDKLLALWNGTPGGTQNCLNYALARGKPVDRLPISDELWAWCVAESAGTSATRQFRRPTTPPAQEAVYNRRRRRGQAPTIVEDLMREQRIREAERTIEFADALRRREEEIVQAYAVPAPLLGIDLGSPGGDRTIVTPPVEVGDPNVIGRLASDMDEDAAREMLRALQKRLGHAPKAQSTHDTHLNRFAPKRKIDLDD